MYVCLKIDQMAGKLTKWQQILTTSSFAGSSKIYPNWGFWFENTPCGNPGIYTYSVFN
jgi:hypothetical protein